MILHYMLRVQSHSEESLHPPDRSRADVFYSRERQRDAVNDRIEELNARVTGVLAEITGLEPTRNAPQWWNWCYDFTDAPPAGEKQLVRYEEDDYVPQLVPDFFVVGSTRSCFAAGTPVWTESGAVPIEKIRVGDRIRAQDIESGELTFKPILLTSVNPPKELMTLRLADESIICTKGHRFWNSGSGWTKARDLEPETLLHTATATTAVRSVKAAPAEKTYNLIVDGFHTYFVGKAAILCGDLRRTNPTDRTVPGLTSR